MSQFYGSMDTISRGRTQPARGMLKSFRQEENVLVTSDKISRLEARIAILEDQNTKLLQKNQTQATKVALLQRFCKYHAIKLNITDAYDRETNTDDALNNMKMEMAGLSLSVGGGYASTISGITNNSPRHPGRKQEEPDLSPRLKVRYDRRVHGGGDGIQNRFLYGSESVSQHKWMGPADGVGSPRLQNSKKNAEENKFRMRVSKDIHGLNTVDAKLVYGSKEYERRLVEEAKAHLLRKDNRRRKLKGPDENKTNMFGIDKTARKERIKGDDIAKLDESLFAGMLNPKAEYDMNHHERHGTDLKAETQLLHRQQYRGQESKKAVFRNFAK